MILRQVLDNVKILEIVGKLETEISEIIFDSRKVIEKSLYIAIKGTLADGHQYISSAIERGRRQLYVKCCQSKKRKG